MDIKQILDEQGYYGPTAFLSEAEILEYTRIRDQIRNEIDWMSSDYRCKANLLFPYISKISKNQIILDHVKQILGPNLTCYDAFVWLKSPKSTETVGYHRDGYYWNFVNQTRAVTVWITLTGATKEMGCLKYVVDSHKSNITEPAEDDLVYVESPPGTFIIHHPYMLHGSNENTSEHLRDGISLCFVATDEKPRYHYAVETATIVSGVDEFNYRLHEPAPADEWRQNLETWQWASDLQSTNFVKAIENKDFDLAGISLKSYINN